MSLFARILAFLGVLLFCGVAQAQGPGGAPIAYLYCYTGSGPITSPTNWTACSASTPVPISGSFSATVSGFAPASTGTPISVTTGGVTGTLPAGTVVVASNVGSTNGAYCKLGASATTSDQLIPPNSWFAFTVGAATQLTCITSTSTTTVNMVGGSGLPTGAGGGGGGGGGGGAITAASGAYASGSISSGAYASGAFASGSISAGAGADGWDVTQGAKTDAACAGDNTSGCSVESRLQRIAQNLTTLNSTAGSSIVAGTNLIGKVTPNDGTNSQIFGPCQTVAATFTPINISASGSAKIITGTAAKKTYICHIHVVTNAANNVALVEGTGSNCGTSTAGMAGGTTAATGWNFSANGGISIGNSDRAVAQTATAADDVCLNPSAATQLSSVVVWVQQ